MAQRQNSEGSGEIMGSQSQNYDSGKEGEKNSVDLCRELGYFKPTSGQRKNVVEAFALAGKEVKRRGFDLLEKVVEDIVDDVDLLTLNLDKVRLIELKTAGLERKQPLGEGYVGMGFTYTGSEKHNSAELGEQYKILLLDLKTGNNLLGDEQHIRANSRVYQTESFFIKNSLTSP